MEHITALVALVLMGGFLVESKSIVAIQTAHVHFDLVDCCIYYSALQKCTITIIYSVVYYIEHCKMHEIFKNKFLALI